MVALEDDVVLRVVAFPEDKHPDDHDLSLVLVGAIMA